MSNKLLDIYKALLDTAGADVGADGCVSLREYQEDSSVKLKPLTIKGRRLVLPTAEQLRVPDWEHRVAFHPLVENISRGESEVMERLRAMFNAQGNTVLPVIMRALIRLGGSPKEHAKLNPEQSEFLSYVKQADAKMLANFDKILEKMPAGTPTKQFVNIFMRRSAKVGDTSYLRAGVVSFPFYADLKKGEDPHGVPIRVKDRETFLALLDWLLPHQGEANYYTRGSNSTVAPTVDALTKAMLAIAGPLNDRVELFGDLVPQDLAIPADWHDAFVNIDALLPAIRSVPMLAGNDGDIAQNQAGLGAQLPTPTPSSPGFLPAPSTSPLQAPTVAKTSSPSGMTDLNAFFRSHPGVAIQAGIAQGQTGMGVLRHNPHAGRLSPSNPNVSTATPSGGYGSFGTSGPGGYPTNSNPFPGI